MSHFSTNKTSPKAVSGAARRSSQKSASQLYEELFRKTHGDRIESFLALQEWFLKNKKKNEKKKDYKGGLMDGSIYDVRRVLYLGSYIHIGASVVWPHHVTYVDMDPKAVRFFQKHTQDDEDEDDEIVRLILELQQNAHKSELVQQEQDCNGDTVTPSFQFVNADYNDKEKLYTELMTRMDDDDDDDGGREGVNDDDDDRWMFDLLISSYAGFVSRAGKDFIRRGGWLLANDSHGDASLAFVDSDDWELAGLVVSDGCGDKNKFKISTDDLDQYMIPKPKRTKKGSTKRKRTAEKKEEDDDDDEYNEPAHPSAEEILQLGRGIRYTKDATAYLFRRL